MDYETVLELVDEMPLQDKQRLVRHLNTVLDESTGPETPARRPDQADVDAHRAAVRAALKGMLVEYSSIEDESDLIDDELEEKILRQLREETAGHPPLSQEIIRERREGP